MRRFIKNNDLVYWAELSSTSRGKFKYAVHSGYYLASYRFAGNIINIVSFGDVSSRVVRHLKSCEIFNTPELAQKRADELNAAEERLEIKTEEKLRELRGTR